MKKRLLVTGYGGFVSGHVVREAARTWDVYALSRREAPAEREGFRCWQFDLRDAAQLREAFSTAKPDAVIHAAALADIDYCQSHRDEAEQVNVEVTRVLANLCRDSGARLILCSTDTIFDGERGMYTEADEPRAVNFYAETKIRAEGIVREIVKNSVVARLSLVMGLPVSGSGNSFLPKLIAALETGQEVRFSKNEIRTPIDVITLARALVELAANDFRGTIHLAGSTRITRFDMARRIAEGMGHSTSLVADSVATAGRAPRPRDVSLDNARARSILKTPMRTLAEGLELALNSTEMPLHGRPTNQA